MFCELNSSSQKNSMNSFHMDEDYEQNENFKEPQNKEKKIKKKKSKSLPLSKNSSQTKNFLSFSPQVKFLATKISRSSLIDDINSDIIINPFKLLSSEFITYDYASFGRSKDIVKNYWTNNHLPILNKSSPCIILKLINSNVDLCTCANKFYIGEEGLDCSMRNYDNKYISIGRQQINEDFIRPNDIMLFPTDPSISRAHFKIFHQNLFIERKKYKTNVDLIVRTSRSKNCRYQLPSQIWYYIILYLKPKDTIDILDNGTIYGTYVRIKEIDKKTLIANLLINLQENFLNGNIYNQSAMLENYYQNDLLFQYKFDHEEYKLKLFPFLSLQKTAYRLGSYIKNYPLIELFQNLYNFFLKYYPSLLVSPFDNSSPNFSFLLSQLNNILLENQVSLTSSHFGFIVNKVDNLRNILSSINIYAFPQGHQITIVSFDPIIHNQKFDANSRMYSVTVNNFYEVVLLNPEHGEYKSICLHETEGDPCGVMNRIQTIIFIDNPQSNNPDTLSFGCQKGFLIGKSKKRCLFNTNMECDLFIYYSKLVNSWMILDISNLTNEIAQYDSEDNFGLWLCTAEDKGINNRFRTMDKGFKVKDGDQIRISESVFEVQYKF